MWASDNGILVRPGVLPIKVTVALDCAAGIPTQPVSMTLTARTMDGRSQQTSSLVAVAGTPWAEHLDWMCRPVLVQG